MYQKPRIVDGRLVSRYGADKDMAAAASWLFYARTAVGLAACTALWLVIVAAAGPNSGFKTWMGVVFVIASLMVSLCRSYMSHSEATTFAEFDAWLVRIIERDTKRAVAVRHADVAVMTELISEYDRQAAEGWARLRASDKTAFLLCAPAPWSRLLPQIAAATKQTRADIADISRRRQILERDREGLCLKALASISKQD
jgi:hypothetical protein